MLQSPESSANKQLLVPGFHAPKPEVDFTNMVVEKYIRPNYQESIKLIGSRAAPEGPWWISKKGFYKIFDRFKTDFKINIENEPIDLWLTHINNLARQMNLTRDQIPTLEPIIETLKNQYELTQSSFSTLKTVTKYFLSGKSLVPGSDIDLLLEGIDKPHPFSKIYPDPDSSQVVDCFYKGEVRKSL